jgi:hypothetical protein
MVDTTMFAERLSTGAVVSTTVIVKLAFPLLPCTSVAEHVTIVAPRANVLPDAARQLTSTEPSTRSEAVGFEYVAVAPVGPVASTENEAGTPASAGGVVSTTVIVNEPVAMLPEASVAEQVTVVVPSGNVEPEVGSHSTATGPSTRSEADGLKATAAPAELVASTV